ncbi:MAG: TolC family protein [Clostridiales bacterium]|nr:TolC family protein [Clostridiales bacterium]
MNKKRIFLILILSLMVIAGGIIASANEKIINSMDFQGEEIRLSLEDALERALAESSAGKTIKWNMQKAKIAYDNNYDLARTLRTIENETNRDAMIFKLMGDFAKSQMDKNYQAELNNLKTQVKQQYFGLLQARDNMKINEDNIKVVEKLYKDTQTKFKLGMAAKQELLTAEYNYLKAQTDYEAAVNIYKKAKMGFNVFMGFDVMQEITLTDTLTEVKTTEIEIADAVSRALINRNEVAGAEYSKEIQRLTFEKISTRYLSDTKTHIDQKVAYETAQNDYENVFKLIEMDVRSKYLTMTEKKHAVEAGRKAVESAEEGLRLVQLTYDAGMAVLTDVQEVQTRVLQSRLGLSKAILDYNLAVDDFVDSMGVGRVTIPIM